jgi:ATP-dependent DNA helicase DinG
MATLIDQAIALGESRVIEASTGIGKSFAYLVPAFLGDARVVISTGTRNLQDQLFELLLPAPVKTIPRRGSLQEPRNGRHLRRACRLVRADR